MNAKNPIVIGAHEYLEHPWRSAGFVLTLRHGLANTLIDIKNRIVDIYKKLIGQNLNFLL